MELKSHSFTSKEPNVAREPQVADPCDRHIIASADAGNCTVSLTILLLLNTI